MANTLAMDPAHARKRQQRGGELAVDVDASYERLTKIVKQISEDGIIRGTWQYKGTTELNGARATTMAGGFEPWQGQGTVFYKERPDALAPQNFYESADQGTVKVRYIVEPSGATVCHLRILAIFAENDGHRSHPSEGAVENAEFAAISQKLQDQLDQEHQAKEQDVIQQQATKSDELREQLERDRVELNTAMARQQQLEKEVQSVRKGRAAHIRTESADLKSLPYNQSKTIRLLSKDEAITVLEETLHWYRVETGNGDEGWVYGLMAEVTQ